MLGGLVAGGDRHGGATITPTEYDFNIGTPMLTDEGEIGPLPVAPI